MAHETLVHHATTAHPTHHPIPVDSRSPDRGAQAAEIHRLRYEGHAGGGSGLSGRQGLIITSSEALYRHRVTIRIIAGLATDPA